MFTPCTEASGKRRRNMRRAISLRERADAHAVAWMRAMEVMVRRDPEGIETQPILTKPEKRAITLGSGLDGSVGDAGAWAKDQRGKRRHRQAGDQAIGADPFDRGIIHLNAAVFEVNGSPPVFRGGKGIKGRAFENGHLD
jgi:hypothetical protein